MSKPASLTGDARAEVEDLLRQLAPQVLGAVVSDVGQSRGGRGRPTGRRDAPAAAQMAAERLPDHARGWLITVASRRLTDLLRQIRPASAAKTPWPAGCCPTTGWPRRPTGRPRTTTTR